MMLSFSAIYIVSQAGYMPRRSLRQLFAKKLVFGVEKLDNLVDQIIRIQLAQIQKAPPQALLEKQQSREGPLTILKEEV